MGCANIITPYVDYKVQVRLQNQIPNQLRQSNSKSQRKLKKFFPNLKIQDHQIFQKLVRNNGTLKPGEHDFFIVNKLLKNHFLFGQLTEIEIKNIICCMDLFMGSQNSYIFREGDPPSLFFIMIKGRISLQVQNSRIKELQGFCSFGQIAVIYSTSRTASVKCLQFCRFWCLHTNIIKRTLKHIIDKNYKINKKIIDSIHWFQYLEDKQKEQLALNVYKLKYPGGKRIYQIGNLPIGLFYILKGYAGIQYDQSNICQRHSRNVNNSLAQFQAQSIQDDQALQQNSGMKIISKGKTFGFQAIISDQQVNFQVTAISQTECISIGRLPLQQILGPAAFKYANLYHFSAIKYTFRNSKAFSEISSSHLNRILAQGSIKFFKAGQYLVRQRQRIQHLFICLQGTLNGKGIGNLINQQVLTVQHIVYADRKIQKLEDGNVCTFEIQKINQILGESKNKIFSKVKWCKTTKSIKNVSPHRTGTLKTRQQILVKNEQMEAQNIELKNINVLSVVGRGQYSLCLLVKHRLTKKVYFLKIYDKKSIVENNIQGQIMNQRNINLKIKENSQTLLIEKTRQSYRPLIPKMYQTFRDDHCIYFLMEYLRGGDLLEALNQQIVACKKSYAKFFFACVVLAVQHLHTKNIIYRDFRHQNFVFDDIGYLYLIDFARSKQIKRCQQKNENKQKNNSHEKQDEGFKSAKSLKYIKQIEKQLSLNFRTKTLVGQPHYASPQMVQGKPYNFATDFWSMGVFLYDLVIGYPPFGKKKTDPMQIYQQIVAKEKQVLFPKYYKDKHGRQIMSKLLTKSQKKRQAINFFDIKQCQFFKGIQWNQILKRKFQPPFHPKIKNSVLDSCESNINKDLTQYLERVIQKEKDTRFQTQTYQIQQDRISQKGNWDDCFSCSNL